MSGHSKWAQIKHKKAVTDARRGQRFTKLVREISVAARLGGGDPAGNPRLRAAIAEAKANSLPKENIDRAIKKGTGELEGESYDEIVLEGYAPGGVAVMVEALTDNRNRTVSDLRHAFAKHGGNLGENGCVAWMFAKRGDFVVPRTAMGEEELLRLALELGAEDVRTDPGESYELLTAPEEYARVADELERRGVPLELKQLAMVPQSTVAIGGAEAKRVVHLLEAIEELDDVQHVWANCDLPAEALAEASE